MREVDKPGLAQIFLLSFACLLQNLAGKKARSAGSSFESGVLGRNSRKTAAALQNNSALVSWFFACICPQTFLRGVGDINSTVGATHDFSGQPAATNDLAGYQSNSRSLATRTAPVPGFLQHGIRG